MRCEVKRSSHHKINRCPSRSRYIYNRDDKTGNLSPHIKTYVHIYVHYHNRDEGESRSAWYPHLAMYSNI